MGIYNVKNVDQNTFFNQRMNLWKFSEQMKIQDFRRAKHIFLYFLYF